MSEMRRYKCHKEVNATPMTADEYYKWAKLDKFKHAAPHPQNEGDGYLVEYDNFYFSWSPKKAFDEGYTEI